MNLIEKYLAKAAGKEHVAPGQDLTCKVSFVAAHDVTAPIAIRMFRVYCFYVLLLGLNGTSEAFFMVRSTPLLNRRRQRRPTRCRSTIA